MKAPLSGGAFGFRLSRLIETRQLAGRRGSLGDTLERQHAKVIARGTAHNAPFDTHLWPEVRGLAPCAAYPVAPFFVFCGLDILVNCLNMK